MKKILCSLLVATACSLSYAGNVYIVPSLHLQRIGANHSTYTNLNPQLGLGYAAMPHNIYMAGEVFFMPGAIDISNNHNLNTYTAKISNSFGASFLPGVMIAESVLGYARLGVITSRFRSPGTYSTGGQLGLGIQTTMIYGWSLRAEYDYSAYRTVAGLGSPKSNELAIGLVYTFENAK